MPQDEMFQKIMDQAQQYGAQARGELPASPGVPQLNMDMSNTRGMYDTILQGERAGGMASGLAGQATYAHEQAAAAAAAKKAAKPKKLPKSDGGFDFLDAEGNPISAYEFSLLEEKDLSEVLKDSMNPEDQKLVQDYDGLKQFWNASAALEGVPNEEVNAVHEASMKGTIKKVAKHDGGFDYFETDKNKMKGDGKVSSKEWDKSAEEELEFILDKDNKEITSKDPLYIYYVYTKDNPEMKGMKLDETRKAFMSKWKSAYFTDPNYKPSWEE